MNQLYRELSKTAQSTPAQVNRNNLVERINNLIQSNPNLKSKFESIMDRIRKGADPKQMFFEAAKQKGADPNTVLSQIK